MTLPIPEVLKDYWIRWFIFCVDQ